MESFHILSYPVVDPDAVEIWASGEPGSWRTGPAENRARRELGPQKTGPAKNRARGQLGPRKTIPLVDRVRRKIGSPPAPLTVWRLATVIALGRSPPVFGARPARIGESPGTTLAAGPSAGSMTPHAGRSVPCSIRARNHIGPCSQVPSAHRVLSYAYRDGRY